MQNKNTVTQTPIYGNKRAEYARMKCKHCDKAYTSNVITRHQNACYLNPDNIRYCEVCRTTPIPHKDNKTCSHACANKMFRSGVNHGNHKAHGYATICWAYHEKKCVVCDEENIVAVHHRDHNHDNNAPVNLIPLCPTHHSYAHSRYAPLIQGAINDYVVKWKYEQTKQ